MNLLKDLKVRFDFKIGFLFRGYFVFPRIFFKNESVFHPFDLFDWIGLELAGHFGRVSDLTPSVRGRCTLRAS